MNGGDIVHAGKTRREGSQSVRERLAALEAEVAMLRELVLRRLADGYPELDQIGRFQSVDAAER